MDRASMVLPGVRRSPPGGADHPGPERRIRPGALVRVIAHTMEGCGSPRRGAPSRQLVGRAPGDRARMVRPDLAAGSDLAAEEPWLDSAPAGRQDDPVGG